MANLQGSGAISINNIKSLFGGPASPALSNYYRGGAYIPSTKTVTTVTRQPATGAYHSSNPGYLWTWSGGTYPGNGNNAIYWGTSGLGAISFAAVDSLTSYTSGGWTYYKATMYGPSYIPGGYGTSAYYTNDWAIYRIQTTSSTVNINTNIPTSGSISLSQFYNAEKP